MNYVQVVDWFLRRDVFGGQSDKSKIFCALSDRTCLREALRRFPFERRKVGGDFFRRVGWSYYCTVLAVVSFGL